MQFQFKIICSCDSRCYIHPVTFSETITGIPALPRGQGNCCISSKRPVKNAAYKQKNYDDWDDTRCSFSPFVSAHRRRYRCVRYSSLEYKNVCNSCGGPPCFFLRSSSIMIPFCRGNLMYDPRVRRGMATVSSPVLSDTKSNSRQFADKTLNVRSNV